MKTNYPRYYKYPGDGYNRITVVVHTAEGKLSGTHRVHSNGVLQDPVELGGLYQPDTAWVELSLMEAVGHSNT